MHKEDELHGCECNDVEVRPLVVDMTRSIWRPCRLGDDMRGGGRGRVEDSEALGNQQLRGMARDDKLIVSDFPGASQSALQC